MLYTNNTIKDYINGKEINNINELENNPDFMITAIKMNRSVYEKCPESLKGDYRFVKKLVYEFIYDLSFAEEIVSNFSLYNKEKNVNELMELRIMVFFYTPYEERKVADCLDIYSLYEYYMKHVEIALNDEENYDILDELGKGFIFLYYEFENFPYIVEFFAIEYLKEMFFRNEYFIQDLIHQKFKNKEDIDKVGTNNFLLNYIASYDPMLSDYISLRLYLLNDIKKELDKVKNNWDETLKQLDSVRKMYIEEAIKDYKESPQYNNSFNCYRELRDIFKELNIDYNFNEYDLTDTDTITNDRCINFSKILFRNRIKKLLNILYKEDYIDPKKIEELYNPQKNTKTKILNLKNIKKD